MTSPNTSLENKNPSNQQPRSLLSKIFPFSWIGSWWSSKGSTQSKDIVSPGVPETKNAEPEDDAFLQSSASKSDNGAEPTKTSWFKIFGNIFSFVRWSSSAKSEGQGDNALDEGLSVGQTLKTFTQDDLKTAIFNYDYKKVQDIINSNPEFLHPKSGDFLPLNQAIFNYLDKSDKKEASLNIVKFLVGEMKKAENPKAFDNSGHLLWAVKCGQIGMVKLWVEEYSATVSSACLLEAGSDSSQHILEFLLKQQIDQEVLNDALRQVARKNTKGDEYEMYNEAVQALIKRGANVNSQDKDGDTALHIAIYYDKFSTIKILLNKNADYYIKNTKDTTPIDLMNEKLSRSEKDLSNANNHQYVLADRNENTAWADENINKYALRCRKWEELIKWCTQSSDAEEEFGAGDDMTVHNLDNVGSGDGDNVSPQKQVLEGYENAALLEKKMRK